MKWFVLIFLSVSYISVYSVPGDTIRSFTLDGQPKYGVSGLEYDPDDGNIWAVGHNGYRQNLFCKFKNDDSHRIMQDWQFLESRYISDVLDIAYPFWYEGQDAIAVLEDGYIITNSNSNNPNPMPVKMFNKNNGEYLGVLNEDPFDGGFAFGLTVNHDKNNLYVCGCDIYNWYIEKWTGNTWVKYANCDREAMGAAYAWGRLFVIHDIPVLSIWVYRESDGELLDKIPLNNWYGQYILGLSRGRNNIVGNHESLYTTCSNYSEWVIREIEVGDYNTDIETTSVGNIKALFH
jgi:hypothetical protein